MINFFRFFTLQTQTYLQEHMEGWEALSPALGYPYRLLTYNDGIFPRKLFQNCQEPTSIELYNQLLNGIPPRGYKLPFFLGIIDGKVKYIDLSKGNLLMAGRTRSGKTASINSILISLFYYTHPEYCKIICLDCKKTSFKSLSTTESVRGLVNVATTYDEITSVLEWLSNEMDMRYEKLSKTSFTTAIDLNAYAYRTRKKKLIMPHIVLIFDEFADFMIMRGEESDEMDLFSRIMAMGIAANIHIVGATQSPYAKILDGMIKANMQYRLSFAVTDIQHSKIVLGTKGKSADHLDPTELYEAGEFIFKERAQRVRGRTFHVTAKDLQIASANLLRKKLYYSVQFPKQPPKLGK